MINFFLFAVALAYLLCLKYYFNYTCIYKYNIAIAFYYNFIL